MRRPTETDEEWLERVEGLFVGQLDQDEVDLLNELVKAGKAVRSYAGVAGFLGLPKVWKVREE